MKDKHNKVRDFRMKLPEKQDVFYKKSLIECHKRGLIPGPSEDVKAFDKRAKKSFSKSEVCEIKPFNIKPDWVSVCTDKKNLHFWEGATTWIEENEEGIRSCSIELRPFILSFLYSKEEILSHELVHATRLMFDEPRFEEILAFRTSKNRFRQYFGPLFTRPFESLLFVILLCIGGVGYNTGIVLEGAWGKLGCYFLWLPGIWLLFCLSRLIRSQWTFSKALENLQKTQSEKSGKKHENTNALGILLYLTDAEIQHFANTSSETIKAYASEQKKDSLRWEQLCRNHF